MLQNAVSAHAAPADHATQPLTHAAQPTATPAAGTPGTSGTLIAFPSALALASAPSPSSFGQTPPPPPPRIPSSHPDAMEAQAPDHLSSYNLLDDIRAVQSQHATSPRETITLHSFPAYLALNVRRVLSRNRSHRADWACALSCLLFQGLARYSGMPALQSLVSELEGLDQDDTLDAVAAEQLEGWRRGFRFVLVDPTYTMGLEKRRSWKAPEYVHTELHDLAGRVGVPASVLGAVAIMAALERQEGVLGEHAAHMRATVVELDERLGERERRLRTWLRMLEAGLLHGR